MVAVIGKDHGYWKGRITGQPDISSLGDQDCIHIVRFAFSVNEG